MRRRITPAEAEARFFGRVRMEGECWVWTALRNKAGYGIFEYAGRPIKSKLAHRWSYHTFVGPIPEGLQVHHECVNPSCVNPAHLRAVTAMENSYASMTATKKRAMRTHCKWGHEYTPENTYRDKKNRRYCRECHRTYQRNHWRQYRYGKEQPRVDHTETRKAS